MELDMDKQYNQRKTNHNMNRQPFHTTAYFTLFFFFFFSNHTCRLEPMTSSFTLLYKRCHFHLHCSISYLSIIIEKTFLFKYKMVTLCITLSVFLQQRKILIIIVTFPSTSSPLALIFVVSSRRKNISVKVS